jgi:hypothetical protein
MTDKADILKEFREKFTYQECNCGFGISSKGIQHEEKDCPEAWTTLRKLNIKDLVAFISSVFDRGFEEGKKEQLSSLVDLQLDIHKRKANKVLKTNL